MTEVQGFFYPRTASGRLVADPVPAVVLLRRPAHRGVPHRPGAGRRAAAGAARARPRGPRCGGPDLGRLAVVLGRPARSCWTRCARSTRRPSSWSAAASRGGPSRAASTSGSTRTSPSPAACTRATPRSSARCGRPGRTRSRRRRRRSRPAAVRRHAGGRRPSAGRGGAHAARAGRDQRLRQLPPDGAPPRLARHRARRAGCVRRADRVRRRRGRGRPGLGAATSSCACSSRRPRSWPGSRSHEIIGGYYRQVGVKWDGGASLARLERLTVARGRSDRSDPNE